MPQVIARDVTYPDPESRGIGRDSTRWLPLYPPSGAKGPMGPLMVASFRISDLSLDDAVERILEAAKTEACYGRMGCLEPDDDFKPVTQVVADLLEQVKQIENHQCDFGYGNDQLCPTCGLDPRS